jgi:hypothetical protein
MMNTALLHLSQAYAFWFSDTVVRWPAVFFIVAFPDDPNIRDPLLYSFQLKEPWM